MKIRQGFVSNSSSSSFIVAFPKKPNSVEELKKMMFPKSGWNNNIAFYDNCLSIADIVTRVWDDLNNPRLNNHHYGPHIINPQNIIEEMKRGHIDGCYPEWGQFQKHIHKVEDEYFRKHGKRVNWGEISKEDQDKLNEAYRKDDEERDQWLGNKLQQYWDTIKDQFQGKYIYSFHYGDENGTTEAVMEHGEIFSNLPHIRVDGH